MRRFACLLAVPVLLALSLSACSGDGSAEPQVEVGGKFGALPEVKFPKGEAPSGEFELATPVEGEGRKVVQGDLVVVDYVSYTWSKDGASTMIGNSFQGGVPVAMPSWSLVKGLKRALVGAKVGSRVVAVIPPKEGYGDKGRESLQIKGDDSLVYVLDVVAAHAKSESVQGAAAFGGEQGLPEVSAGAVPTVAVPRGAAPKDLAVREVKKGTGGEVKAGRLVTIQYVGARWRNGKVFSSAGADGKVYATVIGQGLVIKGWDEALVGRRVGSRLLVVAPPGKAYGAKDLKVKGLPKYGIKADDTLVYVVDVLGVY